MSQSASLLTEVEGLQLRARKVVQGALAGIHRSLRRGTSIEFSEHKLYTPGDEIRHIDWRVYAKTDRYHVKQFEDETNLTVELLLDHSASMGFSSHGVEAKLSFVRNLAAAFTYLALRQGDPVGLLAFAGRLSVELPPRSSGSHLLEVFSRLVELEPQGPTALVGAIEHLLRVRRRRRLVIVLSDLFDPHPGLAQAFRQLAARGHDVAVLHALDPAELHFPYETPAIFRSMEDTRQLFVHPRILHQAYVKEMARFLEGTAREMAEVGIDYHQLRTDDDPARILGAFLRSRARD